MVRQSPSGMGALTILALAAAVLALAAGAAAGLAIATGPAAWAAAPIIAADAISAASPNLPAIRIRTPPSRRRLRQSDARRVIAA